MDDQNISCKNNTTPTNIENKSIKDSIKTMLLYPNRKSSIKYFSKQTLENFSITLCSVSL